MLLMNMNYFLINRNYIYSHFWIYEYILQITSFRHAILSYIFKIFFPFFFPYPFEMRKYVNNKS